MKFLKGRNRLQVHGVRSCFDPIIGSHLSDNNLGAGWRQARPDGRHSSGVTQQDLVEFFHPMPIEISYRDGCQNPSNVGSRLRRRCSLSVLERPIRATAPLERFPPEG